MFTGHKISKREFNKNKTKETRIIADTRLKQYNADHDKNEDYVTLIDDDNVSSKYIIKPHMFGFTTSYIDLGQQQYIAIKHIVPIFIILLLCISIVSFFMYLTHDNDKNDALVSQPKDTEIVIVGDDIEEYKEPVAAQLYINIPGLRTNYNLSKDNTSIHLINPDGNTVYLKYLLSIDGTEIYESDYIKPNAMVKANLYDVLNAGSYNVDVTISSIDIETKTACNGATLNTTININK